MSPTPAAGRGQGFALQAFSSAGSSTDQAGFVTIKTTTV